MTVPLETGCYRSLLTMAVLAGGIVNESRNHGKWDKDVLNYFASQLVDLIDECELADLCQDRANDLAKVVGELMGEPETVDPQQVEGQSNEMGKQFAKFADCIFDTYALAIMDEGNGGPDAGDWPDDPWLQTIRPLRVRTVRLCLLSNVYRNKRGTSSSKFWKNWKYQKKPSTLSKRWLLALRMPSSTPMTRHRPLPTPPNTNSRPLHERRESLPLTRDTLASA